MIFDKGKKKCFVIVEIMLLESHAQPQIKDCIQQNEQINEQQTKVLNP